MELRYGLITGITRFLPGQPLDKLLNFKLEQQDRDQLNDATRRLSAAGNVNKMNTGMNIQCATVPTLYPPDARKINAEQLTDDHQQEALNFLSPRPINTVILSGWIRDHGIVSPQHRGKFYGCRDAKGDLVGVAMIGRNLLFEARTDEAIAAFARCARDCPDVRMVFAKEDELNTFWRHYRGEAPMPEVSRHRFIKSGGTVSNDIDIVKELRIATLDDLDQIVSAHAEMVLAETGVDPLETDADGFRMRCAGRVENGRVWVWTRDGELIFKTDIVSVTPKAIYIEGLWVNPKERGNGYGTRCLTSMCRQMGSNTICCILDAEHSLSNSLYRKAGFIEVDEYARIYL